MASMRVCVDHLIQLYTSKVEKQMVLTKSKRKNVNVSE